MPVRCVVVVGRVNILTKCFFNSTQDYPKDGDKLVFLSPHHGLIGYSVINNWSGVFKTDTTNVS